MLITPGKKSLLLAALSIGFLPALPACNHQKAALVEVRQNLPHYQKWADTRLESLADLAIETLRDRNYGSVLSIESRLDTAPGGEAYKQFYSEDGSPEYKSYMGSYTSDGLRIYSRVDIPATPPPAEGYPVMIFVHGWVGMQDAPAFDFGYKADSRYSDYIDAFVDAGYLVLTPGWRGHGTVNGIPADGMEFMQAWDNGSYLSPVFYAIDVLNLIDGIQTIEDIDWTLWGFEDANLPRVNPEKIHVNGHSQGGDAALTVLAVSGEGSLLRNAVYSGSIWSGCFGTRFAQAGIYGPMAMTLQAFMSGDGTWTGSAIGRDGSVNPDFVFAWPPDWIGTLDTTSTEWSWQADHWKVGTVAEALHIKFSEMYTAVNENVDDINDAQFKIVTGESGRTTIRHDPEIAAAMHKISAFNFEQYLTEPLLFHHSDQDYYSIPQWNADLSARINANGGNSYDYLYAGNTHSLTISEHDWFSPPGTTAGFDKMIKRDLEMLAAGNTPSHSGS